MLLLHFAVVFWVCVKSQSEILEGNLWNVALKDEEEGGDRGNFHLIDKTRSTVHLWPSVDGIPTVVYKYHPDALLYRRIIEEGINHWRKHTCIAFHESLDEVLPGPHIIFIEGNGCWSQLGMVNDTNGQNLSVMAACAMPGIVTHEIGHALGMFHEQSRKDRDKYVRVLDQSIMRGYHFQFNIEFPPFPQVLDLPYDYTSIMHYGCKTYSKNFDFTIETLNPLHQALIGQRQELSHFDKYLINTIYPCRESWIKSCNTSSDPCLNHGYIGSDCKCVCPPNTKGPLCEYITGGYYDDALKPCSEVIYKDQITLTSTLTSNHPLHGIRCVKLIRAPRCHMPQLTFRKFHFRECQVDSLIVSFQYGFYNSSIYCNDDILPGQVLRSRTSELSLFSEQRSKYAHWEAYLEFIPEQSCRFNQ